MIRIIGGIYKGRYLKLPDSKTTRPTMDKVRQAIFNAMNDKARNSICLDLFAGSGAMGIEALSRGASKVYFVDKDKKTFQVLKENVTNLEIPASKAELYLGDYRLALKRLAEVKFDLVFLDPPYRFLINKEIIKELLFRKMLNDNALIITEQDAPCKKIEKMNCKEYHYGQKSIGFYTEERI